MLEKKLERKIFAFDTLFRLFEKLAGRLDAEGIIRLFLMTIVEQLGIGRVAFYRVLPGGMTIELGHVVGKGRTELPRRIQDASHFIAWIEQEKRPVDIKRYHAGELRGDAESDPVRSLLEAGFPYCSPVYAKRELLGILLVGRMEGNKIFSDADAEFLGMIVMVAGAALGNAAALTRTAAGGEKAGDFSRIKGEFIRSSSIELAPPVGVLKSALYSLEPGEVGGEILVDMAKDALVNLEKTVDQLISVAEMNFDDVGIAPEDTDISSLIEDCLREYIAELEEKRITVRFDDAAGPVDIPADPSKMKIVIRSIIDGALASFGSGGVMEIVTAVEDRPPAGIDTGFAGGGRSGMDDCITGRISAAAAADFPELARVSNEIGFAAARADRYYRVDIGSSVGDAPVADGVKSSGPSPDGADETAGNREGGEIRLSLARTIVAGHRGLLQRLDGKDGKNGFSLWLPMGR